MDFKSTSELLKQYCAINSLTHEQKEEAEEAILKLKLLDRSYKTIKKLHQKALDEDKMRNAVRYALYKERLKLVVDQKQPAIFVQSTEMHTHGSSHIADSDTLSKLMGETEGFYNIAFRIRLIIRSLPELSRFESEGVRDVRNILIQHSGNNKRGTQLYTIGVSSSGPVIKPVKREENQYKDEGLFRNALEFKINLDKKLNNNIDTT